VRDQEWDSTSTQLNPLHFSELERGFLSLNSVDSETAFGIIKKSEVLSGLFDADDVHQSCRVGHVGAHFSVDLDEALHHDGPRLTVVQGILESVSNENNERQAISFFVGTGRWLDAVGAAEFIEKPVIRGGEPLLVLLSAFRSVTRNIASFAAIGNNQIAPETKRSRNEPVVGDSRSTTHLGVGC
jgi:hypothetical protein